MHINWYQVRYYLSDILNIQILDLQTTSLISHSIFNLLLSVVDPIVVTLLFCLYWILFVRLYIFLTA